MTTVAVVVTANHFWLDGVAAAIVLLLVLAAQWATRWLLDRRAGRAQPARPASQPARTVTRVGGG